MMAQSFSGGHALYDLVTAHNLHNFQQALAVLTAVFVAYWHKNLLFLRFRLIRGGLGFRLDGRLGRGGLGALFLRGLHALTQGFQLCVVQIVQILLGLYHMNRDVIADGLFDGVLQLTKTVEF